MASIQIAISNMDFIGLSFINDERINMQQFKKLIKKVVPLPVFNVLKHCKFFIIDLIDLTLGHRDSMTPPTCQMFDGPQNLQSFMDNGEEFLKLFTTLCQLKPDESILDVGSGIGRKTIPLTKYLNKEGRYEGIEIVQTGVNWCKEHITKKFPNFNFQQIDVYNEMYNPKGKCKAADYRFPFEDRSFDFIILGSVFTHMLPDDVENYFSEIARVLKKNGRCLISYFLLNRESLQNIQSNKSTLAFTYDRGVYHIVKQDVPEYAISYNEDFILDLYTKNGMQIVDTINYGSWCGRNTYLSYQDLVLAVKQ